MSTAASRRKRKPRYEAGVGERVRSGKCPKTHRKDEVVADNDERARGGREQVSTKQTFRPIGLIRLCGCQANDRRARPKAGESPSG